MHREDFLGASPRHLVDAIKQLEADLNSAKRYLDTAQRNCSHKWDETKYEPIVREAYTDPGDPPGTMGVDWRGPTFVPRSERPRWTRTCPFCLKVEETAETQKHVSHTPKFR